MRVYIVGKTRIKGRFGSPIYLVTVFERVVERATATTRRSRSFRSSKVSTTRQRSVQFQNSENVAQIIPSKRTLAKGRFGLVARSGARRVLVGKRRDAARERADHHLLALRRAGTERRHGSNEPRRLERSFLRHDPFERLLLLLLLLLLLSLFLCVFFLSVQPPFNFGEIDLERLEENAGRSSETRPHWSE